MMLVCASVVKTGSTWWVQLANELLARHGGSDTSDVRRRWRLGRVIKGEEFRVGPLRAHRALALAPAARFAPSFAVKTHAPPAGALNGLLRLDLARVTLNIRDPRDIVVSAVDHAEQRRANPTAELAVLRTVDDAVDFLATQGGVIESWRERGATLIRYEDLVADPAGEVIRLAELMELAVDRAAAGAVVDTVHRATETGAIRTKRNVGVAGRHREVMTEAQLERANRVLAPLITAMGYPLD